LKIKLKGRHFKRIQVIEAESQSVMNNLTEHDFQDAFKKKAEALGTVHTPRKGADSRVMVASGPKVNF
jgi:predicted helicase